MAREPADSVGGGASRTTRSPVTAMVCASVAEGSRERITAKLPDAGFGRLTTTALMAVFIIATSRRF